MGDPSSARSRQASIRTSLMSLALDRRASAASSQRRSCHTCDALCVGASVSSTRVGLRAPADLYRPPIYALRECAARTVLVIPRRRTTLEPRCRPFAERSRWSLGSCRCRAARTAASIRCCAGPSLLAASAMRRWSGASAVARLAAFVLGLATVAESAYNTTLTRGAGLTLNGCSGAPRATNAAQLAQLAKDVVSGNPSGWATGPDMRLGPYVG